MPRFESALLRRPAPHDLTAREKEVLKLIAGGLTNKEIAAELVVSVATVERHVANIYGKIGARGRADATATSSAADRQLIGAWHSSTGIPSREQSAACGAIAMPLSPGRQDTGSPGGNRRAGELPCLPYGAPRRLRGRVFDEPGSRRDRDPRQRRSAASWRRRTSRSSAGPDHLGSGEGREPRRLGAELVYGDLKDPASIEAACRGATAVFSTATTTVSRQPGDTIESVDRVGQLGLVDAARAASVSHYTFVSVPPVFSDTELGAAKEAVEESAEDERDRLHDPATERLRRDLARPNARLRLRQREGSSSTAPGTRSSASSPSATSRGSPFSRPTTQPSPM